VTTVAPDMTLGGAVVAAPEANLRAAAARRLFVRAVNRLPGRPLSVRGPDGRLMVRGAEGAAEMHIRRDAFFRRLGAAGKIGFGEAYMAGDWESAGDLAAVLKPFAANVEQLVPPPLQRLRRFFEPRRPGSDRNTVEGAARNIRRHYDLSNELFALFLDETMTYSCAIFEPGDTLAEAQRRKLQAVAQLAGITAGHRVLEIGSGWGGMAVHLATTYGCPVTSITISREQAQFARRRVIAAGVQDLVDVQLCDYRRVTGRYDRIVSIEMFEAVGERYWRQFFAACEGLLAPGGRLAMQTITMPHRRYRASRGSYTWIHKYIFPGGVIPSIEAVEEAARGSALRPSQRVEIGRHYATTLRAWRQRFTERREQVLAQGFGEEFIRMWELYLAYCEAGFATGQLSAMQLTMELG
jgi:cyclopropane-fatty-acyl-phospholipid synthase